MRQLHPALWIVPAVMLGIAVFPLPYGYYEILRVVVFGSAAFLSWKAFMEEGKEVDRVALTFGAMALLMNPFLPVTLPRLAWIVVDILFAVVFIQHLAQTRRTDT